MSAVTAACPNCKQPVSVDEAQSELPTTCSKCQTAFIPAQVIAEANKKFEMMMYVGMIVVALALVGYMAITNRMKPKQPVPAAPAASEPAPGAK